MKEIPLTQGKVALVDDEDFDFLNQWKWYAHKQKSGRFYAERAGKDCTNIFMHRVIMQISPYHITDHKDGNGLNNQKSNLRECTYPQNAQNSRLNKGNKGVYYNERDKLWIARLQCNGDRKYIKSSKKKEVALAAYDSAAKFYFGDFAQTNEVKNGTDNT